MIKIVISSGDPSGIGPEIVAKSLLKYHPPQVAIKVFGALLPFRMLAQKFAWANSFINLVEENVIEFVEVGYLKNLEWGRVGAQYGDVAFRSIVEAVNCARQGNADAIITAPISKEAMQLAGHNYPGHTEILSDSFGVDVTMMLFSGRLRISLATTHIPIRQVAGALDDKMLLGHILRTYNALRNWFGIAEPTIGVLGLNPHAGEGGRIGEEEYIISAAIKSANERKIYAVGPLVPDVAFLPEKRRKFDAYLAMYHDQGLIPLKTIGFRRGVNITLGLPIPRTSPDHGTAFDIAGRGIASSRSFIAALRLAVILAEKNTIH